MKPTRQTYTTAEVCAIYRRSRATIAAWVEAGVIPGIKTPGGIYLFTKAEIDAALRGEWHPRPAHGAPRLLQSRREKVD